MYYVVLILVEACIFCFSIHILKVIVGTCSLVSHQISTDVWLEQMGKIAWRISFCDKTQVTSFAYSFLFVQNCQHSHYQISITYKCCPHWAKWVNNSEKSGHHDGSMSYFPSHWCYKGQCYQQAYQPYHMKCAIHFDFSIWYTKWNPLAWYLLF